MRHEIVTLSGGWRGTRQTVGHIKRLIEQAILDPVVVLTAHDIVRHLPERDKDAEIEAISDYVRRNIRYTRESVETTKTPRLMIEEIRKKGRAVGDCDDAVTLWLALHRVVGSRVRVGVISQRKDKAANHIFGEVFSPDRGWVTDDTVVKRKPLGWRAAPEKITEEKLFSMNGLGALVKDRRMKPVTVPVGRTRCIPVEALARRKKPMRSRYIRASGYKVKSPSMLYVDAGGGVSGMDGLGQWDAIAQIAQGVAQAGAEAYKAYTDYRAGQKRPTVSLPALPAPSTNIATGQAAPQPAPSGGGSNNTLILLGLGLLAVVAMSRPR